MLSWRGRGRACLFDNAENNAFDLVFLGIGFGRDGQFERDLAWTGRILRAEIPVPDASRPAGIAIRGIYVHQHAHRRADVRTLLGSREFGKFFERHRRRRHGADAN